MAYVAKSDDLSAIPGTHRMERIDAYSYLLTSSDIYMCIYTHTQIIKCNKIFIYWGLGLRLIEKGACLASKSPEFNPQLLRDDILVPCKDCHLY